MSCSSVQSFFISKLAEINQTSVGWRILAMAIGRPNVGMLPNWDDFDFSILSFWRTEKKTTSDAEKRSLEKMCSRVRTLACENEAIRKDADSKGFLIKMISNDNERLTAELNRTMEEWRQNDLYVRNYIAGLNERYS